MQAAVEMLALVTMVDSQLMKRGTWGATGVREVLTIPYEAYNAILRLHAPTIPQPIFLMNLVGIRGGV